MPHARGFIPPDPALCPDPTIVVYKDQVLAESVLLAASGGVCVWGIALPADPNCSRRVIPIFERKLFRMGFTLDQVDQIATCLAEDIPNAMGNAPAGSNVSMTFIFLGQRPHRIILFLVDNFLAPGQKPLLPVPDQVPEMEEILYDSHGRGTGISQYLAQGMAKCMVPGYHILAVLHFVEAASANG